MFFFFLISKLFIIMSFKKKSSHDFYIHMFCWWVCNRCSSLSIYLKNLALSGVSLLLLFKVCRNEIFRQSNKRFFYDGENKISFWRNFLYVKYINSIKRYLNIMVYTINQLKNGETLYKIKLMTYEYMYIYVFVWFWKKKIFFRRIRKLKLIVRMLIRLCYKVFLMK